MVRPFDELPGIESVLSGYTGGHNENPTYQEICAGGTGHVEVVQITFQPDIFPYEKLVELFWQQIDPTDSGAQFHDREESYKTAIFYHSENQKTLAEKSKHELEASGRFSKPIVTSILEVKTFYPAEDYHKDYYKKDPEYYKQNRAGRDKLYQTVLG
jgi:peptide methionine sulfoxide reductase msrA/msrB